MEITPTNQSKSRLWLMILGTAVATAITVILILYGMGMLGHSAASMNMIHSEGMDHEAHMNGRQAEVAELGRGIMPFDLERTTHVFNKQEFGGIQQVISDDGDAEQIALIQTHLQEEFNRFQQGDFSDPAHIHGDNMPGLAELQAGYEQLEVTYTELPDGAQINYSSENPELIEAIHAWFEAQLMDHGAHATDGS